MKGLLSTYMNILMLCETKTNILFKNKDISRWPHPYEPVAYAEHQVFLWLRALIHARLSFLCRLGEKQWAWNCSDKYKWFSCNPVKCDFFCLVIFFQRSIKGKQTSVQRWDCIFSVFITLHSFSIVYSDTFFYAPVKVMVKVCPWIVGASLAFSVTTIHRV